MGVGIHGGTMPGAVTPMCDCCGVALCWDISEEEYEQAKAFWDAWICQDCNGGESLSLKHWMRSNVGFSGDAPLHGAASAGTQG